MSAITQAILPIVLLYKYWALFGITFIAAFILPIPPGTLIMASAAFSYQGYFDFGWVIAVSVLGNVLGDNAAYFLARRYGKQVLSHIGFRRALASKKYQKVEERITRHPGFLIFISRFEVTINLIVNIVCGIGRVPYTKYLFFETAGEIVQVALYGTIGYAFGSSWQTLGSLIGRGVLVIVLVGVGLFVLSQWFTRRRRVTGE